MGRKGLNNALSSGTEKVKKLYKFRKLMRVEEREKTEEELRFMVEFLEDRTQIAQCEFWQTADWLTRLELCNKVTFHTIRRGHVRMLDLHHAKEKGVIISGKGKGELNPEALAHKLEVKRKEEERLEQIRLEEESKLAAETRKRGRAATIIQARQRGKGARKTIVQKKNNKGGESGGAKPGKQQVQPDKPADPLKAFAKKKWKEASHLFQAGREEDSKKAGDDRAANALANAMLKTEKASHTFGKKKPKGYVVGLVSAAKANGARSEGLNAEDLEGA